MNEKGLEPRLTPRFVSEALGLHSSYFRDRATDREAFTGVTTDSRKIQPGCLFVAIPGDKFDGHDFIPQAIEKGALGVVCRREAASKVIPPSIAFKVENSLKAYRRLAAAWRQQFRIPIVAVAGSVGKTSTKEILAAALRGRWPSVLKTQGSQNGFVGIPMTLLELNDSHGAAVIEVGIDEPGAMAEHIPVVAPTASVLTAISPEHLEKLIDLPTVAREEGGALTATAAAGGLACIFLDDPWIRPHATTIRSGRKIFYTFDPNVTAPAGGETLRGTLTPSGTKLKVAGIGLKSEEFALPLPGEHNARNLLAAVAVAFGLGLAPAEIRAGLKTFEPPEGRSQLKSLPDSTIVLCDYYNANPASVEAALALLTRAASRPTPRPRWACLGDMLELGPDEERFHRALASKLIDSGVEHVLLYGPRMKALAQELSAKGFRGTHEHFETHDALSAALAQGRRPGDAVLIKGSRGMRMEEIWKSLSIAISEGSSR